MSNSVVEQLKENAAKYPKKTAIICDDVETTYEELWMLVRGYSNFLAENGVKRNGIVVSRTTQSLNFAVSYWATHLCGAAFVPVENGTPKEKLQEIAKETDADYVLEDEEVQDVLSNAKSCFCETKEYVFPEKSDVSDILFTTGTSGKSKGVVLSHRALLASVGNLVYGNGYKEDTIMVLPGPLNHANAIRKLYTCIYHGCTVIILNGMMAMKDFFHALDHYHANALCLPPSAVQIMLLMSKSKIGNYADQIDFIESAGAALPKADADKLKKLLPKSHLYIGYGSSEAGPMCEFDYNKYEKEANCIGEIMPCGTVIIVDENKQPITSSKNNLGLLACGGDIRMEGYFHDEELTKETMDENYVYTNDIGYIDEEGFVYIISRRDDVINSGGLKIAPMDVENVALEVEGVNDCLCIAVKDPVLTFAPKLLVVPGEGFDMKELQLRLKDKLEPFKVPKSIDIVDEIKKTYNGKPDRKYYRP